MVTTSHPSNATGNDVGCHFLSQLVNQVEVGLSTAESDVLLAAKSTPIHGMIMPWTQTQTDIDGSTLDRFSYRPTKSMQKLIDR